MSSVGDIDEDELLQIALKEQAERDLSYQKPSKTSKPVVNLVQPPPLPHFMEKGQGKANANARGGTAAGKGQRRPSRGGADDDDDSEVELLSISSGDEDTSRDRAPLQRNRERRAARDDRDWEGDEPRSWKKVDEAELARRVREMRETRAAPAQSLEPKGTALGRKALTNLQSLPRGVEVLDPLGLGVIDNKSLRLITEASISSPVSRGRSDPLDPGTRVIKVNPFAGFQVGILKRVLEEVEKVMQEFRVMLYKSMEDPQLDLADLDADSSTGDSLPVDSRSVDLVGEKVDALRGTYIHRLTAVVIHHMPAFWRLALSVFSGKFAKVTAGNTLRDSETNVKPAANRSEDKVGEVKYSSHSLEEVAAMVHGTISAFEVKVLNTFRDFEESNILRPFMSDAIREIAKTCQALEGKESAPPTAVKTLRALHFEITKIYVLRLCSWMRETTKEMAKDEIWVPLSILERNKSPYAISYLPLAFQTMTMSAMDRIDVIIQYLRSEATKSDDILEQVQEIQESVRLAFLNCFLDFAAQPAKGNILFMDSSQALFAIHSILMVVIRDKDELYADTQDLATSFLVLEEKILEQYTFAKVFSGARPLLEKTLGILVEGLIDTFISLFHENKTKDLRSLDANGFCQLMLELEYFETVLHMYFSPDAMEALKSLQGLLLEKACESANESSENPGHHRRPTRGSEDAMADDRQQGPMVPPDDLIDASCGILLVYSI
ncbi:hypothetical protein COCNU_15G001600 [Cocos nucifera]|uniref:Exocyst complex component SEC5 n=1 Tax=Cocos nucifera TaxID=13894 RepID=A0A8K0IWI4_COCNU|nr:hypothetical protein COCNU_15G001600 [Cocos nucifera]